MKFQIKFAEFADEQAAFAAAAARPCVVTGLPNFKPARSFPYAQEILNYGS